MGQILMNKYNTFEYQMEYMTLYEKYSYFKIKMLNIYIFEIYL